MLNLFLSDLYKIRKSTTMRIILAISAVCAVVMALMAYFISTGELGKNLSGINFLFGDANVLCLISAVAAGVFICGDFDNKAIHDTIAAGGGRVAIVVGKALSFFIVMAVLALPYAVTVTIAICTGNRFDMAGVSIGFAHMMTVEGGISVTAAMFGRLLIVMLIQIIVYVGQGSLCVLFSFLFKKPVLVVAVSYVLSILSGQLQSLKGSSELFDRLIACTPYNGDYCFLTTASSSTDLLKAFIASILFSCVVLAVTALFFRKAEIK